MQATAVGGRSAGDKGTGGQGEQGGDEQPDAGPHAEATQGIACVQRIHGRCADSSTQYTQYQIGHQRHGTPGQY
ncbi:hypothetical protein D3C75_1209850 [compost metagenome]